MYDYEDNEVFEALAALSEAWKEQFENPPKTPMAWAEKDDDGMIFLDALEVCPTVIIDLDSLSYDEENLWIGECDGDEVQVHVNWISEDEVSFEIV